NNVPPPASGNFNLELVVNATGTGTFATAPGYQGLAIRAADGHTLTMLHGDYGAVDNGAGNTIFLGDGSESIGGAIGDTILGGSGPNQFLDGHLGHQSITDGTAGNETIWGAATDTVRGGSGGTRRSPASRGKRSPAAPAPMCSLTRPAAISRCSAGVRAMTRSGPPPATRSTAAATMRRSAASPASR